MKSETTLDLASHGGTNPRLWSGNVGSYIDFLSTLHTVAQPDLYLEIGTQMGVSLRLCNCQAVAIDPAFQIRYEGLLQNPLIRFLEMTSDAAFLDPVMTDLRGKVDLAFIDGLHLIEYVLRDVMNTEKVMAPGGLILIHDTAPFTLNMASREFPTDGSEWTGDVWKILPILAKYRPDLRMWHLACAPTGLTVITGDWGNSDALSANYDAIIRDWRNLTLNEYGPASYYAQHALMDVESWIISLVTGEILSFPN